MNTDNQPPSTAPDTNASNVDDTPCVLIVRHGHQLWLDADGLIEELSVPEAVAKLKTGPVIVCHKSALLRRLNVSEEDSENLQLLDVLELFTFVRPATFTLPSPKGLARALSLPLPEEPEAETLTLMAAAQMLSTELEAVMDRHVAGLAWTMAEAGWAWGPLAVRAAFNVGQDGATLGKSALHAWNKLEDWKEEGGETPPKSQNVTSEEALRRLSQIRPANAEERPEQAAFTTAATQSFEPAETYKSPKFVMAEAGTGVGKTLGYVAPASVWAEKNGAPVWISTYTRNLQRQVDDELDLLYPNAQEKSRKVVVRKGRENYLCLLNYEDAVKGFGVSGRELIGYGLIARWLGATRSGDLIGGDMPGWLMDLAGPHNWHELTDRRGECIYAACPHYRRCFVEKSARKAKNADLVIANHALVMVQLAVGGDTGEEVSGSENQSDPVSDLRALPTRYVFDEGHHLFDAADSSFSAHLSGQETCDLRRWLIGEEAGRRSGRLKGFVGRLNDLELENDQINEFIPKLRMAARVLPAPNWSGRLQAGAPVGEVEAFLTFVGQQVYARSNQSSSPFSIECDVLPCVDGLADAAGEAATKLEELLYPIKVISEVLHKTLADQTANMELDTRRKIEAILSSLHRRALMPIQAWVNMLNAVFDDDEESTASVQTEFVDWMSVERVAGKDRDLGMHRHFLDPTKPLVQALSERSQGVLVTSATLRDQSMDMEADWKAAEARTGAIHLLNPAVRSSTPSPFDYAAQTEVIVVNDVRKDDLDQVAAAYRELFLAAGGGALGLFTAISRLRAVYDRIETSLQDTRIPLYAQHVDPIDVATLIDLFRDESNACLLGTDAVRDGVDVPGDSLRLLVFDRVPWPRPDILHRSRKEAFGGSSYVDMLVRLKLRQAYGRLVRRANDKGVFVLLDPMMPSRLETAFPESKSGDRPLVHRVGIKEAVDRIGNFFG
ncbi:MAG: ATP-dependent DNA helicase [Alphaproteobacteria bacterium]